MMRRFLQNMESILWWAVTLALVVITIGGLALLIDDAPGWTIYRSGGLNPMVSMSR